MKERDILRAMKDADSYYYQRAYALAERSAQNHERIGEIVKRIIKIAAAGCAITAAVIGGFFLIRSLNRKPIETVMPGAVIETEPAVTTAVTETTAAVTETKPQEPIEVGDGLYQVFALPQFETVKTPCAYGTVFDGTVFDDATTKIAYFKTLDFSKIFPVSMPEMQAYCVPRDQSAVYVAQNGQLYRTDMEMQSPELLLDDERLYIHALLSFPNTNLLYFDGRYNDEKIIGSFDPETKQITHSRAEGNRLTLCNTGVLLSDVDVKRVYYWECGNVYEIPLTNWSKESNYKLHISANGKYLCTFMDGQTKDGYIIDRCSVYDVKTGKVIRSFQWEFHLKYYGRVSLNQLEFLGFDEAAQQVYLKEMETAHLLRFDFGEPQK